MPSIMLLLLALLVLLLMILVLLSLQQHLPAPVLVLMILLLLVVLLMLVILRFPMLVLLLLLLVIKEYRAMLPVEACSVSDRSSRGVLSPLSRSQKLCSGYKSELGSFSDCNRGFFLLLSRSLRFCRCMCALKLRSNSSIPKPDRFSGSKRSFPNKMILTNPK